jgi:DNA modification methylase
MTDISKYLENFSLDKESSLFDEKIKTRIEYYQFNNHSIPKYINEYWTAKQRQANSLHEISYRACFKPQLPRFFIELLTKEKDIIYDPFSGRGTTALEAALLNRRFIANDINPLSEILLKPRVQPPTLNEIAKRLDEIDLNKDIEPDIDLYMFYHENTLKEIINLRDYLIYKNQHNKEDYIDEWIRMVATNRLTGHSKGFFSVYTLPPNQTVTPNSQIKINQKKNQLPEYRNVKKLILNKSNDLLKDINEQIRHKLWHIKEDSLFFNSDARNTSMIESNSISLTVTSPPFLDIVQYANDNWLRCWFNNLDVNIISNGIEMSKTLKAWNDFISKVFDELYRVTKNDGFVAFEVGEIRNGMIKLDEIVVDIGINSGFNCLGILINEQIFTKTSNIWGVNNNNKGTNTNRIVIFQK